MRNGFTLIEVVAATAILMNVIAVAAPITSTLLNEQATLSERRTYANALHDELQSFLWNERFKIPQTYSKDIQQKTVNFQFKQENEFVKGCVDWENARQTKESFCLYGVRE